MKYHIRIFVKDDYVARRLDEVLRDEYSLEVTRTSKIDTRDQSEPSCFIIEASHYNDLDLITRAKLLWPDVPIIAAGCAVEGHHLSPPADLVVGAIKTGAVDFIDITSPDLKIKATLSQVIKTRELKNEIDYLRREQDIIYDFNHIIARSPSMKTVIETLKEFAKTDGTILITGETGTGKSFLSGAVHFNSERRNRPFVKINCANIPEHLLESELFGHEKGAFTGANKTRIGRIEQARGGTVFLDEIAEMSPALQAKLLRFLEEKSFERLGSNKTIEVDVRIIAATNRNLEQMVAEKSFREDLYYRLNILRIHIPPLRERKECIEPLAKFILAQKARALKKNVKGFSREVIEMFKTYRWPGNIRQLANIIERAVILCNDTIITEKHVYLPELELIPATAAEGSVASTSSAAEEEKQRIIEALEKCNWIQKEAARVLNISPRMLNYKIKKYGITHPQWRVHRKGNRVHP
ncbi:sigma-54 interaction domain-containing protein [Thermodesulforhabdus norvegica]|uniref:Regulatory protein, Fis family n=1 Tax=Thermodesulforhabdus norvegica TaxID=39841 RepID=A0A1I4UZ68_9BACT|nr:sigma-54 dependent transcriptional regulator [Thermodesulforhabdus norvegica]SFM94221.1 regulatory protein, Fis family [Thermodesulforhabdus norvegica]